MRVAAQIMGHSHIEGQVRTEEVTMIKPQNRRQDRVLVDLPHILYKKMLLFNGCRPDRLLIDALVIFFFKICAVELQLC